MKKHLLFLFTLLIVSGLTAQAQFKFGLKAGVNLSKLSYSGSKDVQTLYNDNVENLTGFQVGPMAEFTVPILGIGADAAILYSQEGFKIKEAFQDLQSGELIKGGSYKTNTLEVPINLKYKITFLNVVGAFGTVGPYFKFRLSDDLLDQYKSKSFGAGLNFGIGVELLAHLQVGVAYKLGLTDDYSQMNLLNTATNVATGKMKTSGWLVSAAYLF